MKKSLIALALIAAVGFASAADVTVSGGRNVGADYSLGSVAVGTQLGSLRAEGTLSHSFTNGAKANVVGGALSLPIVSLGGLGLAARVDGGYVMASGAAANGFTAEAGVEASYALTKRVSVVSTIGHVFAQDKVRGLAGNQVTVGIRTSF